MRRLSRFAQGRVATEPPVRPLLLDPLITPSRNTRRMRCRAQRGHNGKLASPFLLSRRQAVTAILAGIITGAGGRWLRADTIVPASQALAGAKPKSVRLFTAEGARSEE